jgi:hypothetical protein
LTPGEKPAFIAHRRGKYLPSLIGADLSKDKEPRTVQLHLARIHEAATNGNTINLVPTKIEFIWEIDRLLTPTDALSEPKTDKRRLAIPNRNHITFEMA